MRFSTMRRVVPLVPRRRRLCHWGHPHLHRHHRHPPPARHLHHLRRLHPPRRRTRNPCHHPPTALSRPRHLRPQRRQALRVPPTQHPGILPRASAQAPRVSAEANHTRAEGVPLRVKPTGRRLCVQEGTKAAEARMHARSATPPSILARLLRGTPPASVPVLTAPPPHPRATSVLRHPCVPRLRLLPARCRVCASQKSRRPRYRTTHHPRHPRLRLHNHPRSHPRSRHPDRRQSRFRRLRWPPPLPPESRLRLRLHHFTVTSACRPSLQLQLPLPAPRRCYPSIAGVSPELKSPLW